MSRMHLTSRIVHAATGPTVRKAGPKLAKAIEHLFQFIGFGALGVVVIIAAAIAHANGIPWPLIKTVVVAVTVAVVIFGLLIAAEQIRLTYQKQDPSVYEAVEPFEQRRPFDG